MENDSKIQLSENELLELIQVTGFRSYSEKTFFSKLAITIKKEVLDKYPRTFKCFYITFFIALIINIAIPITYHIYSLDMLIKYLQLVPLLLLFVSSGCLAFLFVSSVITTILKTKYLITDRYTILGALSDIVSFVMTAGVLSISFVAYIDLVMHIGFGIVKSIVITFRLDPFSVFPLFINILVASAMFMIIAILQKMLIPSNIRIKAGMYLVLYIINLLTVITYVSGTFLNYVDFKLLILQSMYYYNVFCDILIWISINYLFISFYTKVNYLYSNVNLNNLHSRLIESIHYQTITHV